MKIRPEEEHKYNSPWNVAAEFDLDMSFSIKDISGMLAEYEAVWQTGMEVKEIAELLYEYTSGYPFLVSWLCKYIDETLVGIEGFPDKRAAWSKAGILEAVKAFLNTPNTLIDDMRKKIADYSELREMLYTILFSGQSFPFNPDHTIVEIGMMFGFIKNVSGSKKIGKWPFPCCSKCFRTPLPGGTRRYANCVALFLSVVCHRPE